LIITLATPHTAFPIRIMDESIHKFYNSVNSYWKINIHKLNNFTILSISGGYRDEMIYPTLCDLDDIFVWNSTTISSASSILASNLGIYNTSHDDIFGMDHQAIVWCHNLLTAVRDIILLLINTNNTANMLVQKDTAFSLSLREADQIVQVSVYTFFLFSFRYKSCTVTNIAFFLLLSNCVEATWIVRKDCIGSRASIQSFQCVSFLLFLLLSLCCT
jgi:hypothetical protein